jgi:hypothetical protein
VLSPHECRARRVPIVVTGATRSFHTRTLAEPRPPAEAGNLEIARAEVPWPGPGTGPL